MLYKHTINKLLFSDATSHVTSPRFGAMDIQRGIIMLLMAFSHAREYVSKGERYSNLYFNHSAVWQGSTWLDIFQQILISTVASGGFFMMMGIGMVFLYHSRLRNGWSLEKTCFYFIKRGTLLIFLQLTLLQCFEFIASRKFYFYAGVLLSLGIDMILASICIYIIHKLKKSLELKNYFLQYTLPMFLILTIIFSTQLFINNIFSGKILHSFWTNIFILGGTYQYFGIDMDINFTAISWLPAVLFGLVIGELIYTYRDKSFKFVFSLSLSLLLIWLIIRTGNLFAWFHFGSYKFLEPGEFLTLSAYFSMSKYPPSLTYFLWAIGINLLFISIWQQIEIHSPYFIKILNPIKIFGQCALLFFILHWFIYYGISLFFHTADSNAFSITALWLIGLIPLYIICKNYYKFKSQTPASSIWRMF